MKKMKFLILTLGLVLLASCTASQKKTEKDQATVGADRDSHGCIASAGYTWSEVRKDCIRLFESGTRLEGAGDKKQTAYLVFSPDSSQVELFFSNGESPEILDRRSLPGGGYAWNVEDDDTKNVRRENGAWIITQRQKTLYKQEDPALQTFRYEGVLPAADGPGIRYRLTVQLPVDGTQGTYSLAMTYLEANNGKDETYDTVGTLYILRDATSQPGAIVWQLDPDPKDDRMNFLVEEGGKKITLLNSEMKKSDTDLNYTLTRVS